MHRPIDHIDCKTKYKKVAIGKECDGIVKSTFGTKNITILILGFFLICWISF